MEWKCGALCALLVLGCGDNKPTEEPPPTAANLDITDLSARLVSETAVALSWSDSADETGYRIERRGPNDDDFTAVETVNADTTAFSDTGLGGGAVQWRIASIGESEEVFSNVAGVAVPLAAQPAAISVNLTSLAVTVSEQPNNFVVTGVASLLPTAAPSLDIAFTVKNMTGRVVYNVKTRVTNVDDNVGVTASAKADGDFDGSPFAHHGNHGVDVGADSDSATFRISDIDVTATTLDLEIDVLEHALAFGDDQYYDSDLYVYDTSGVDASFHTTVSTSDIKPNSDPDYDSTTPLEGAVGPDGRTAYFGMRNQPTFMMVDLLTLTLSLGPSLMDTAVVEGDDTGAFGMVRAVRLSPDGKYLYATLMTNLHAYECSTNKTFNGLGTVEIVKLDRKTMMEEGRAVLLTGIDGAQGRALHLSADGSRGSVAIKMRYDDSGAPAAKTDGRFFVINTDDMTVIDGDPTSSHNGFDVRSLSDEVQGATISPDGSTVYVVVAPPELQEGIPLPSQNPIAKVDIDTGTITPIEGHGLSGEIFSKGLVFGPDGRLYWSTYEDGAHIYDPADGSWLEIDSGARQAVHFTRSGLQYVSFEHDGDELYFYDMDDNFVLSPAAGGEGRPVEELNTHADLITPF